MIRPIAAIAFLLIAFSAQASDAPVIERAIQNAVSTFEEALPQLGASEAGVDVAAYRDALGLQQFSSRHWGGTVEVDVTARGSNEGSCSRFAAFVRLPPQNGVVQMVLCPQFFTDGADGLRELTILHEMVHVVAGPDECQAMAFAARVQMAATGSFTPVDGYWQASGCASSAYRLP